MKKVFILFAGLFIAVVIAACSVGDSDGSGYRSDDPASPSAAESNESPEPEESKDNLSTSQLQAVGSAESYLEFSSFSRKGLINQLEFEGYSTADAEFAVDYLDVDWKEQAVKSAERYLEFQNFSRQGLVDQLEFEGFSSEEAEHGVSEAYDK